MNQIVTFLCSFALLCISAQGFTAEKENSHIQWLTSYEEAVNQSKASLKPIVLFFTGSDWCGWCNKLESEVLNSPAFAEAAANQFIFLKLDFPLYTALDAQLSAQNKQLQAKFDVRSFPTLILLDSQQQQIGVTGYKPGGGRQYGNHLLKMVTEYSGYKRNMQNIDKQKFSAEDLKKLYDKAKELDLKNDAYRIVKAGLNSNDQHFFLTERFRFLAEEGQIHDPEAAALKQRLLALDPNNEQLTHYEVALIEFEAYSSEMERDSYSPDLAISPLAEYVEKFKHQDRDNLWRLEMIISQVYLDKNRLEEALEHAQYSYNAAPSTVQPEIALAIKSIQTKLISAN